MLLGTREVFTYSHCQECGSAHILNTIDDFSKYYPETYHCFQFSDLPIWKRWALWQVYKYNFSNKGILGYIVCKVFKKIHWYHPEPAIGWIGKAVRILNNNKKDISIVDIGCWWGTLLSQIKMLGYTNISWVEPFAKNQDPELHIANDTIENFLKDSKPESYDLVILSHVFEHVFNQIEILKWLKRILKKDWVLILAMPVLGKAFHKYGTDYLAFDAPRHVSLLSEKWFRILCDKCDLNIEDTLHEEVSWNLFASEMYGFDISFNEIKENNIIDPFLKQHSYTSDILNQLQDGGSSVTFFLKKR
jgi:SAM-dependent methyltransferase